MIIEVQDEIIEIMIQIFNLTYNDTPLHDERDDQRKLIYSN